MKFFKKKNLSDELSETLINSSSTKNYITCSTLFLGIGILTSVSLYFLKKFKKPQDVKYDKNIVVHITEL